LWRCKRFLPSQERWWRAWLICHTQRRDEAFERGSGGRRSKLRATTFNARAKTVETKPFFRDAFKRTRCLIPASGYYEWKNTPHGKQPYYFSRADGEPMTFAGLWDEWKDRATGEKLNSCTMIITEPNEIAVDIHDRMPVILESADFDAWLRDGGTTLLNPAPNYVLQRWPVSRHVNSSKADTDDPTLIEKVELAAA
jgi:putative SOS response-associated peptidase YedK